MIEHVDKSQETRFINYLSVQKQLSQATLREYTRMLELIRAEAGGDPFKLLMVQSDWERVINVISDRFGWTASTRYRLSIVCQMFGEYLYRERVIDRAPYKNSFKKQGGKRVEHFTEEEFKRLAFNPFHSITDFVMLIVFWDCGMRKSELISLNIGDVDLEKRTIKIINCKTKKLRINPITESTQKILALYFQCLKHQGKLKPDDPLFYSPTWERLHESTLARHLKEIGHKNDAKLYAHKLRHSLGGRLVEKGADLSYVKELLGHENLNTTAIYTHFETAQKREMFDRLNQ